MIADQKNKIFSIFIEYLSSFEFFDRLITLDFGTCIFILWTYHEIVMGYQKNFSPELFEDYFIEIFLICLLEKVGLNFFDFWGIIDRDKVTWTIRSNDKNVFSNDLEFFNDVLHFS